MLNKAISLRKDYVDAMTYMDVLYRLRAEVECGSKKNSKPTSNNPMNGLIARRRQERNKLKQQKKRARNSHPTNLSCNR